MPFHSAKLNLIVIWTVCVLVGEGCDGLGCDCRTRHGIGRQMFSSCYWKCVLDACPRWEDVPPETDAVRVRREMSVELFGQNQAIHLIANAFSSRRSNAPLSFHFVGTNGVGKTMAARLIGRALFQIYRSETGLHKGELYLRGSTFRAENATQAEALRMEMRATILSILNSCSQSLIIIDEVELINRKTIAMLQEFLDDTFPWIDTGYKRVKTGGATFVFISDFGAEGITQEDTYEDVLTRIRYETERIWGDTKQAALIQHIVPFIPLSLSQDGPILLIHHTIRQLSALEQFKRWGVPVNGSLPPLVDAASLEALTNFILDKARSPLYKNDNYRAIPKIFLRYVDPYIVAAAEELAMNPESFDPSSQLRLSFSFNANSTAIENVKFVPVESVPGEGNKDEL
eukprot:TRINITY_DN6615_c0_g1_i1.p1 TRINITY_DN6615_c0_g1~~TRINITY_DN6615_c0_g1_i1.p1  ORF type:complete len:401 (-),score=56.87 TRINITY_DN6615_c0_g1_i1:985-2187(-)